ncbi:MAG: glycosyltransferase family 2 protein [Amphiplicatus sp.]
MSAPGHPFSAGSPRIAVILPCYNEEAAIAGVVADFRKALPEAAIYVFDNASTDATATAAREAGAIVRMEPMKGKGNAVRRAFADIDADIYVMADGDGTYAAAAAPAMIEVMRRESLDMVVGVRVPDGEAQGAYRPGHVLGNRVFSFVFRRLFRLELSDLLSGYRVLSRRFVKSFPSVSKGFEIELEMSAHAALLRTPVKEIPTRYGARPDGSKSKLNTWLDGARILRRMLTFLRLHRPLLIFGGVSLGAAIASFVLAVPIVIEYLQTGLVPRFPTLMIAIGVMLAGVMLFIVGVILDAQARYFSEMKRLQYLQSPAPAPVDAADALETVRS